MPTKPKKDPAKEKQLKDFLAVTKKIESSDGRNTDHATMKSGIHAGQAAMGSYGLMPNTIREFANRQKDPQLKALAALPEEQMRATLAADPGLEERVAGYVASHVLNKYQDPKVANFAFQYGHNLPVERATSEYAKKDPDRLAKFEKYSQEIAQPQAAPMEALVPTMQAAQIGEPPVAPIESVEQEEPEILSGIRRFLTK